MMLASHSNAVRALTRSGPWPSSSSLASQAAKEGKALNMEEQFSQLTLDVIGLSVFNYDYDSLTADRRVQADRRTDGHIPFSPSAGQKRVSESSLRVVSSCRGL